MVSISCASQRLSEHRNSTKSPEVLIEQLTCRLRPSPCQISPSLLTTTTSSMIKSRCNTSLSRQAEDRENEIDGKPLLGSLKTQRRSQRYSGLRTMLPGFVSGVTHAIPVNPESCVGRGILAWYSTVSLRLPLVPCPGSCYLLPNRSMVAKIAPAMGGFCAAESRRDIILPHGMRCPLHSDENRCE